MIDQKVEKALQAALSAFSEYSDYDATPLTGDFSQVFSSEGSFLDKVDALDAIFDENPQVESLREIFFDLLLINFFSEDVKKLEEDYLETEEWADIEEQTLDRGTEILNLLLYLNECEEEGIEPGLADYLTEFLLVDEDEFQDEHRIYEPVIVNQILMESPANEIKRVALDLPGDSELKEIFYPMMCFFQGLENSAIDERAIAANAIDTSFDMAVIGILESFI
ncbi:MAG: hypothetical protein JST19_16445 [Bacteroidetes bacterium]|nr:hypothetical protein [Bacteroidota bacterium]